MTNEKSEKQEGMVEYVQEEYPSIKFYIKKNKIEWQQSFCMEADSDHIARIEENERIKYVAIKPIAKNSPLHVGLPFWKFIIQDEYPKKVHVLLSDCLKILAMSNIWETLKKETSLGELEPRTSKKEMLIKLKEDTDAGIPVEIGTDMVPLYYKILNNMVQRENALFLYYRSSAFSHSCKPNAEECVTEKGIRNIYACRDIQAGEEITVSYLTHYWNVSEPKQREAMLQVNNTICNCKLCIRASKRIKKKIVNEKY